MTTPLARQIIARAKAQNMPINTLGKASGLPDYAIRNILMGNTQKPKAEVLQAISVVLSCSIEDLLKNQEFFKERDPSQSREELRNRAYQAPQLLAEVVSFVNDKIASDKKAPTIHQVLTSIEEIYLHSIQNNSQKIDQEFADWFVDLMGE